MALPLSFFERLPKTDLHVHLDGSLRLSTLIELARSRGVALPSESEEGLLAQVFRERYRDLPEYLEGFRYTVAVHLVTTVPIRNLKRLRSIRDHARALKNAIDQVFFGV